jgi:predicted Zn-dependent protease
MKLQVVTSTRYLLARNAFAANHIMKRIKKGELDKDRVLFVSQKDAYSRRSRRPMNEQGKTSVFEIKLRETRQKDGI